MGKSTLFIQISLGILILILAGISFFMFRLTPYAILNSNLEVEIPSDYKSVTPGSEIWFTTKLLDLEDLGRRDITLQYEVLDKNKNPITSKSETVAIQTQASFVASIQLPTETPEGDYSLKVTLIDTNNPRDIEAESSFKIKATPQKDYTMYYYYSAAALIILIIIIFIATRGKIMLKRSRIKSKIKKIVNNRLPNPKQNPSS